MIVEDRHIWKKSRMRRKKEISENDNFVCFRYDDWCSMERGGRAMVEA